jgi:hypothetical protein
MQLFGSLVRIINKSLLVCTEKVDVGSKIIWEFNTGCPLLVLFVVLMTTMVLLVLFVVVFVVLTTTLVLITRHAVLDPEIPITLLYAVLYKYTINTYPISTENSRR